MTKMQSNAIFLSFFVLLFLAYSFLTFKSSGKFVSPDETANFYFTRQFAGSLSFKVLEPLNSTAPIVAPRSIVIQKDSLVPGSFLGMPLLYGIIGWFLGKWIILFLTPLISVIAVFVFYKLISLIFDHRTALISAGLMALHPAFWYYTARGMFHNALFVDLLIVGFYFFAKALFIESNMKESKEIATPRLGGARNDKREYVIASEAKQSYHYLNLNYFLAGLVIGSAIAVRTSEIIWIVISLMVIVAVFRKLIDWRIGIWTSLLGMIVSMVPILYQNNKLYGSALTFSYSIGPEKAEAAAKAIGKAGGSSNIIAKTFDNIIGLFEKAVFPFGIHWDNIFANLWNYGIWLVWPFALLTLFGLMSFIRNAWRNKEIAAPRLGGARNDKREYVIASEAKQSQKIRYLLSNPRFIYIILYIFISAYLVIYYGSWNISDNVLGQDAVSLEQSYARYWLPIYIFGLPFAALAIQILIKNGLTALSNRRADSRGIMREMARNILIWLFAAIIFNFSISSVMLERNIGLAKVRQNTIEYKEVAMRTKKMIETNAIIVAGKADKIFFPEFKVIASEIDTGKKAKQLKKILRKAPVYISILDFAGQSEKLNKLESFGFKIGKEIEIGGGAKLYKLITD